MSDVDAKEVTILQEGADVHFGSKADMCSATRYVRFVPIADISQAYSITSSARASSCSRQREAKRFGGFEIDDQFILGRCLHRHVGRLFALEDAINIAGRASVLVDGSGP